MNKGNNLTNETTSLPFDFQWNKRYTYLITIAISLLLTLSFAILLRLYGYQMYPFFIIIYIWIAVYIALIGGYMKVISNSGSIGLREFSSKRHLAILLGLGAITRLSFLGSNPLINIDALYYLDFFRLMSLGNIPYTDFYFPYPPVFAYMILGVSYTASTIDSFRILASVFDLGIITVLWKMNTSRKSTNYVHAIPFAYALLPMSIIESGLNGHFESIANLFLLLSIYLVLIDRTTSSGAFLGLSIATKVYAVFLLPLLLILIPEIRGKIYYLATVVCVTIATFIPFYIATWLKSVFGLPQNQYSVDSVLGFTDSLLGYLLRLDAAHQITVAFVAGLILSVFCFFILWIKKPEILRTPLAYDFVTIFIGILLLVLAFISAIFPYTTLASEFYWKYPADISIVRGITTMFAALIIMRASWQRWRGASNRYVSSTQFVLNVAILLLILASISRDVFTGWYLLWSLPPLFLIRDKRMLFICLVGLLLLYPSYIHDDFAELGFDEPKIWNEDFSSMSDWTVSLNTSNGDNLDSELTTIVGTDGDIGVFSIDASGVGNASAMENIEVVWSRNVSITVSQLTEFVIIATSYWNPTFGKLADVAIEFESITPLGNVSHGTILPTEFSLRNHTFHNWRYSFVEYTSGEFSLEITRLQIVVKPHQPEIITIFIDAMYTVESPFISTNSILLIALLAVPNFISLLLLNNSLPKELEFEEYDVKSSWKEQEDSGLE
jgi:hypothetical protein